ncbi:MAG: ABC transporter permease [Actinobacteria bacterium]|nr:ABC transporter permease [Actinomycetota bacterium]
MTSLMPFVVVGVAAGAIYGLAGVGLVLTYRTSGVFNFAHGAVASAGAFLFYELYVRHGWPWPVAAAICLVVLAPTLGILLELVGRRLAEASSWLQVVGTVGLLLAVQGLLLVSYGSEPKNVAQFLPRSTFRLPGVNVSWDQVIVVAIGVGVTLLLSALLRRTPLGIAMRGAVDNPALLELTGISAVLVRQGAWIVGAVVAVASGILLAPVLGVDPFLLTLLVVQAFGAAAIGRFRHLGWTMAGGIGLGVLAAIGQRYASDFPTLLGLPPSLPFFALFAILIVSRPSTTASESLRRTGGERFSPLPAPLRRGLAVVAAGVVAVIPFVVGPRLPVYISAAAFAIIFLSLGLLVNLSGQVSLCHAAFVAVGAASFSHLRVDVGLPWPLAVLGAALLAVPVGALVAVPAIRLSGIYLGLATFGFGVLLERMVYRTFLLFGSESTRLAPRPVLGALDGTSNRVYFFIAAGLAGLAAVAVVHVQRSRLGRVLEAVADSPVAVVSFGASVTTALVLVFCFSAFLAGGAGAILASGSGAAGPGGLGAFESLLWLAVIAISGRRVVPAAVVAACLLAVVPIYLPAGVRDYQTMAFGVAAVTAALVTDRLDVVGRVRRGLVEHADRADRSPVTARRLHPLRSPVAARGRAGTRTAAAS